jgi:hypothetical protein
MPLGCHIMALACFGVFASVDLELPGWSSLATLLFSALVRMLKPSRV